MTSRPLWSCPNCGQRFVSKNMPHSCGQFSVEKFLTGKSQSAILLYRQFELLVFACGLVQIAPAKTRIGFQVRMIFAAVNKLGNQGLDAQVVLARRLDNPRFRRIEKLTPRCHVYHFRIETLIELDGEVQGWLRGAYQVGTQGHLSKA